MEPLDLMKTKNIVGAQWGGLRPEPCLPWGLGLFFQLPHLHVNWCNEGVGRRRNEAGFPFLSALIWILSAWENAVWKLEKGHSWVGLLPSRPPDLNLASLNDLSPPLIYITMVIGILRWFWEEEKKTSLSLDSLVGMYFDFKEICWQTHNIAQLRCLGHRFIKAHSLLALQLLPTEEATSCQLAEIKLLHRNWRSLSPGSALALADHVH